MMKVTVLNVTFQNRPHVEPLGTEQFYSILLSRGFQTKVFFNSLNCEMDDGFLRNLLEEDILVFTGLNNVRDILDQNIRERNRIANSLRTLGFAGTIIATGHQATSSSNDLLSEVSAIDAVIQGDTDVAANYLVDLLSFAHIKEVKGVYTPNRNIPENNDVSLWKAQGLIEICNERPYLNTLTKIHPSKRLCTVIESSRGCSHSSCTFCSTASFSRRCFRPRFIEKPVDMIVNEICNINDRYQITKFIVEDDLAAAQDNHGLERLNYFAAALITLGNHFEFSLVLRPDSITENSLPVFKALSKAGLKSIYLGVESFLESDLQLFGKKISLEQLLSGIDLAQSIGFGMNVKGNVRIKPGLMPFHPYTTLEGIRAQTKYLHKYSITPVKMLAEVELYPGTHLYDLALRDNLLAKGTRSGFKYKYATTDAFHTFARKILKQMHQVRKEIRNIEKTAQGFTLNTDIVEPVRKIRICLEKVFVNAYEGALDGFLEEWGTNDSKRFFESVCVELFQITSGEQTRQVINSVWQQVVDAIRPDYKKLPDNVDPLFFRPCWFPVVH